MARSRIGLLAAAAGLALVAGSGCAFLPRWEPGEVVLRRGAAAGPPRDAVVYLEAEGGPSGAEGGPSGYRSGDLVEIRSRGPSFRPPFTVVQAGERVRFVNDGAVAHRLFTAEDSGRRERLVAPGAAAEPLTISRPGENRFYCSLHPDESFLVFAAPSPWFVVLGPPGERHIAGVPGGSYRLTLWSEAGLRRLGSLEVRSGTVTAYTLPGDSGSGN